MADGGGGGGGLIAEIIKGIVSIVAGGYDVAKANIAANAAMNLFLSLASSWPSSEEVPYCHKNLAWNSASRCAGRHDNSDCLRRRHHVQDYHWRRHHQPSHPAPGVRQLLRLAGCDLQDAHWRTPRD